MKYIITILLFGTFLLSNAQDKVLFSYDPLTGNQIVRTLCINCQTTGKPAKETSEIENEDLLKFSPEDAFSYYPNPVREELYLKWELGDTNFVTMIQITGITGQILKTFNTTGNLNSQNIPFQSYPGGVYIVSVTYKNGDQKIIKIIKK